MSGKATLIDSIPNDECFTIEDLAEELNLGTLRVRQLLQKAMETKRIQKLVKKDGRRTLYAPQMVDQFKAELESGRLGKMNKKRGVTNLKHAELVIKVPVFDAEIVKLLLKKFESEDKMSKFLKSYLEESVKSLLAKKRELQEKYERELSELFHEPSLSL